MAGEDFSEIGAHPQSHGLRRMKAAWEVATPTVFTLVE